MIFEPEERLIEHKKTLETLKPNSDTQAYSGSFDYMLMQTFILGFQDAAEIAENYLKEIQGKK